VQCAGACEKPKCGTEHDAATSSSMSNARGSQRLARAEGREVIDPKGGLSVVRLSKRRKNPSVCQRNRIL